MDKTIITAVIIAAASFIMQKTLGNILYGIIIFISRPFKKGDKVSIKWNANEIASGHIIKRTPLHIYVKNYERDVAIIPNSLLENCTVVNSDYKTGVNYTNYIKISFDSDIAKTKALIKKHLIENPDTHNDEENTYIILKSEPGGIIVEYNVRTDDVDKSFDICSVIKEQIITEIQHIDEITLV